MYTIHIVQGITHVLHAHTHTLPLVPYRGVALHVAGLADRLVVLHNIGLSSQNTVTVEAAEVFQVPVLVLGLCVLITEDQL